MTPLHSHDCTNCKYLGTVYIESKEIDFYYCLSTGSVVGRLSSEPDDYWSAPATSLDTMLKYSTTNTKGTLALYGMAILAKYMLDL